LSLVRRDFALYNATSHFFKAIVFEFSLPIIKYHSKEATL